MVHMKIMEIIVTPSRFAKFLFGFVSLHVDRIWGSNCRTHRQKQIYAYILAVSYRPETLLYTGERPEALRGAMSE